MKVHHGHSQFKKSVQGPGVPWKASVRKRSNFFTHHLVGTHNIHKKGKLDPDSLRLIENNSRINESASRAQSIQKGV